MAQYPEESITPPEHEIRDRRKKEKTKGIQEAYPPNRLVQCLCEYLLSNLEQYSC